MRRASHCYGMSRRLLEYVFGLYINQPIGKSVFYLEWHWRRNPDQEPEGGCTREPLPTAPPRAHLQRRCQKLRDRKIPEILKAALASGWPLTGKNSVLLRRINHYSTVSKYPPNAAGDGLIAVSAFAITLFKGDFIQWNKIFEDRTTWAIHLCNNLSKILKNFWLRNDLNWAGP